MCGPSHLVSVQSHFHDSTRHSPRNADDIGERVLRETRYDRDLKARLREIEDDLARLTCSEVAEVLSPQLLLLLLSILVSITADFSGIILLVLY